MSNGNTRDAGLKPRLRIGTDVLILQNSLTGRITAQWRADREPWQYSARYVNRDGALCSIWLRADELAAVGDLDAPAGAGEA